MKLKIIIILAILLSFFLIGCNETPPIKAREISFSYSSGAMHLEWGSYEIEVDSEGKGTLVKKLGHDMEITKTFSL